MKCVALALVFLSAAGCQAHFKKLDAPSRYEHVRAAVVSYLTYVKESAQKAVASLDDAEFKDFKASFNQDLDKIEAYVKSAASYLAPVRKGIGPKIVEFISAACEKVSPEIEELLSDSVNMLIALMMQLENSHRFMRAKLEKYVEENPQIVEEFKTRFEPLVEDLQEKINVYLTKAKSKVSPIVEVIRKHLNNILEDLDTTYRPHVQRHWEEIERIFSQLLPKCEIWGQKPWQLFNPIVFSIHYMG